jgi:hypothetical protein
LIICCHFGSSLAADIICCLFNGLIVQQEEQGVFGRRHRQVEAHHLLLSEDPQASTPVGVHRMASS